MIGSFYCIDVNSAWHKLASLLQKKFPRGFKARNKESFESCLIFEEKEKKKDDWSGRLRRRIKVYNKVNCSVQSQSAASHLGMSLQDFVKASYFRSKLLEEANQYGLTRIEISYKLDNI